MSYEPLDRDQTLADALADAADPFDAGVDWSTLRNTIARGAAPELARRRGRDKSRFTIPASLAAGIALFILVAGAPFSSRPVPAGTTAAVARQPIDELLDANVSDVQFRAMVSGASDADELLAIAAQEERP
jgi:hypothetical protein